MGKHVRKQELREFRELAMHGEQAAVFGLERVSFLFFSLLHMWQLAPRLCFGEEHIQEMCLQGAQNTTVKQCRT